MSYSPSGGAFRSCFDMFRHILTLILAPVYMVMVRVCTLFTERPPMHNQCCTTWGWTSSGHPMSAGNTEPREESYGGALSCGPPPPTYNKQKQNNKTVQPDDQDIWSNFRFLKKKTICIVEPPRYGNRALHTNIALKQQYATLKTKL
jgi:hypothetical protein